MQLDRKLAEWQKAGVLSAEDAARIVAYEGQEARPYLLYAVGGLGALTIALGVIAIIASNWEFIPGGVKLAIDVGLAIGLAVGLVIADRRGASWLRETLIGLYWGYILASIGLISQVYHLGGATWQALLTWTVLTAPLVLLGHSGGLAATWALALHATYFSLLEPLSKLPGVNEGVVLGLVGVAPLLCLVVGSSSRVARKRPEFAQAFAAIGWMEALAMTSVASFAFYDSPLVAGHRSGLAIGAAVATALTAVLVIRAQRLIAARAVLPLRVLLVLLLVLSYGPLLIGTKELELVGALVFIGLWAVVAWVGYASHNARLLSAATAVIGLRVVIVYFEVFGSLLDTGLGLVTGGLLTVGLTYLWARKRREISSRFEEEDSP